MVSARKRGLIDFLCVFVSPVHLSATWRNDRGRERKRKQEKEREAVRGHPQGPRANRSGVSADALCLEPIHLHRLRFIRENTCTALHCIVFCLHARLPVFTTAATSGRRASGFKKNICTAASKPSKQTVLMKVVTVPKYKATLLTTNFPLIKNILSIGTVFFPVYWGKSQQLIRQLTCVRCCAIYNTHILQGYAVIDCNAVHFYCSKGKSLGKVSM